MDTALIDRICREVYRKYPEVSGIKPRVRATAEGPTSLIFEVRVQTADGHPMRRIVRASVSPEGRILKMSASKS